MACLNLPKHIAPAIERDRVRWLFDSVRRLRAGVCSTPSLVTQPTPSNRLNKAPISPSNPSASLPEAPSAKTPPKAPRARIRPARRKARRRLPARKALNTWLRFVTAHVEDHRRLASYLELGHKNHVAMSRTAQQDIKSRSALYLPANNHTARINYARIAAAHVVRFTETLPRSTPVFWVTLIAEQYTVPLDQAGNFDPYRLQQWARAMLPGCSFVGMVEAALYTNVGLLRHGLQRAVSWHVHLLVWGITAAKMTELRDGINRSARTMIPGVKAAHFRQLEQEQIEGQIFYMLKAPVNEYRVYPMKETVVDDATGEVMEVTTGRFRTKKYQLGPGDLVRTINLLSGQTLDGLAFATGEGMAVLPRINAEARAPRVAKERLEAAREAALLSGRASGRRRRSGALSRARRWQ